MNLRVSKLDGERQILFILPPLFLRYPKLTCQSRSVQGILVVLEGLGRLLFEDLSSFMPRYQGQNSGDEI